MRLALPLLAIILASVLTGPAGAQAPNTIELALPRRAADGEAVWAQVRAGKLPRGAQIIVSTAAGAPLGSVSPFGLRSGGRQSANYSISLPKSALTSDRVTLRLQVAPAGGAVRAPQPGEVESVTLIYVPVSKTEGPPR
jgi:hypothetical protein